MLGVASSLPSPSFGVVLFRELAFGSSWGLIIVEGQGRWEVRTPIRASGVVGSGVVVSSVVGVMSPVAWLSRLCHCL